MSANLLFPQTSHNIPYLLICTATPFLAIGILLASHKLFTTWNYHRSLRLFSDPSHGGQKLISPIVIPYSIPWLGHTLSFMNQTPGKFWQNLISWLPRHTGVCTLIVGGRKTHILYSPTAVQAIFRAKGPNRDLMEQDMFREVFGMGPEQIHAAESTRGFEVAANAKYLNNFERVNELTAHFTQALGEEFSALSVGEGGEEVNLYSWLHESMFSASVYALFGSHLREHYPSFEADFVHFDVDVLRFLYRIPKFLLGDAFTRRARMFIKLEEWSKEMTRLSGGAPVDPDEGPAWEPLFGSRFNRARQRDYKLRGLSRETGAALDAGLTFGLASNAIPATGWMLFNILDPRAPKDLLPKVLKEIDEATKEDDSLDIATLISQPLLQSIFTETLRIYTDVLVARSLPEDIIIPVDEDGKYLVSLRKNDFLLVPCWLGHRDNSFWSSNGSPQDVFDAERFLDHDPKTSRATFAIGRLTGKFLPFGGGKTICPGRTFAKQEAIGALAMVLKRFDFDVKGFVDPAKKPTKDFPAPQSSLPGSGVLAPGGDMRVWVRTRN